MMLSVLILQPDSCRPHEVTDTTKSMSARTSPTDFMRNSSLHFHNSHRQGTHRQNTHPQAQPINMKCLQTHTHLTPHDFKLIRLIIISTLYNYIQNTQKKHQQIRKKRFEGLDCGWQVDGTCVKRVASSQHDNNQQPMESVSLNCVQSPVLKEGAVLLLILLVLSLLFTQGSDVTAGLSGKSDRGKR